MKLSYYPGCTLKNKAQNLELAALASLRALGVEVEEMPRWNCCGAVYSLAQDDLIHQVAPVRNMIRAMERGSDAVVTICSQCYNTLARANRLMANDEEKRGTLNLFMDEEPDYHGQVQALHLLQLLRDHVGWERVRAAVKVPLTGLKAAPFYGCSLVRPCEVSILEQVEARALPVVDAAPPVDPSLGPGSRILEDFLAALGADVVEFPASTECCGAYQVIANPSAANDRAGKVLSAAVHAGVDTLVLSCPLCEYNLGTRQDQGNDKLAALPRVSTIYFTQLLAIALGLADVCQTELNNDATRRLLRARGHVASPAL